MLDPQRNPAQWQEYKDLLLREADRITSFVRELKLRPGEHLEMELGQWNVQSKAMFSAVCFYVSRMNKQSQFAFRLALEQDLKGLFIRYAKAAIEFSMTPEGRSNNPPPMAPTAYDDFLMAFELIRPQEPPGDKRS